MKKSTGDNCEKNIFRAASVKTVLLVVFLAIAAVGLYARIWEMRQPEFLLPSVHVTKILPYRQGGGDLHWSLNGRRVYIQEDQRLIDFPMKKWNRDIQVGDTVTITVRRSFFGNELDGLNIQKVK